MNAEVYCQQLRRLKDAIAVKRPGLVIKVKLQHDKARPHTANLTQSTLDEFGWEVLPHPPYSPDLAPSDFHLFRAPSNDLKGTVFTSQDQLKEWVDQFFSLKPKQFFHQGIHKLPQRWEEVIRNEGCCYIVD